MKTIIIDSSSAILLFKSGMLSYLLSEYRTLMTKSVHDEILKEGYPGSGEFREYFIHKTIKIISPKKGAQIIRSKELLKLDKGEQDTIRVFLNGIGDFVIIDDGKGAGFCKKKKIPYINALLAPRILYESQIITQPLFYKKFNIIIDIGRYTPKIIDYAYNCPKNDLEYFFP